MARAAGSAGATTASAREPKAFRMPEASGGLTVRVNHRQTSFASASVTVRCQCCSAGSLRP